MTSDVIGAKLLLVDNDVNLSIKS